MAILHRALWAVSAILMIWPRIGGAQEGGLPAKELFSAMTTATEIGTDEAFQTRKEQRGFLPDVVAPKGLRDFMARSDLSFHSLRAGFRQERSAAALLWSCEAESEKGVDEVVQAVQEQLEGAGYTEGDEPPEPFFQPQYDQLRRRVKQLLTFRKELAPCRALVTVSVVDRDARADSKVTLAVQWYVLALLAEGPLTLKDVTTPFPMLASRQVDSRIIDALAGEAVSELDLSLQKEASPLAPRSRILMIFPQWILETPAKPPASLTPALTAAGYTQGASESRDRPVTSRTEFWRRENGDTIGLFESSQRDRSRTRLTARAAARRRTADNRSPPPVRLGRKSPAPDAKPIPIAALLATQIRDADVTSEDSFAAWKNSSGIPAEAVAPKGLRGILTRPEWAFETFQARWGVREGTPILSWTADTRVDAEIATLAEQIETQMAAAGLKRTGDKTPETLLPVELSLLPRRARLLQAYEKVTGETTEFVVVAFSDRTARDTTGVGLALHWYVESPVTVEPVSLTELLDALPALRPGDLDQAIVEAMGDVPLLEWERLYAPGLQRTPRSSGMVSFSGDWRLQARQDLRSPLNDALTGVGFTAAGPKTPDLFGNFNETWRREEELVSVALFPPRQEVPMALPQLIVSHQRLPVLNRRPRGM